jgi:hypothetical protein
LATWAITLPIKPEPGPLEPAKVQIVIQELVEVTPQQEVPPPTVEEAPQQEAPPPTVEEQVTDPIPTHAPVQQSNKDRKKNRSNNSE